MVTITKAFPTIFHKIFFEAILQSLKESMKAFLGYGIA